MCFSVNIILNSLLLTFQILNEKSNIYKEFSEGYAVFLPGWGSSDAQPGVRAVLPVEVSPHRHLHSEEVYVKKAFQCFS